METVTIILLIIVVLSILPKIISFFYKPMERSYEFVLKNLKKIPIDKDDDTEFDDFVCVPIANKRLDEIREYCSRVYMSSAFSNYSEEEKATIYSFISELEDKLSKINS